MSEEHTKEHIKEHIKIYNDSLGEFLDIFSKNYNLDTNELKQKYTYVHTKKLTGYMLFVKDMYAKEPTKNNEKFTERSKRISKKWKSLDKNIKKQYNDKAISMNNKNKKVKKPVKIEEKEPIVEEDKIDYNGELDNTTLFEFEKDGEKYIKDIFDNLIGINEENFGTYIGYIKDDVIVLF